MAYAEPGMTASRLAELSGLTSGAITGVLDRLERANVLRREPDPADRRRILIRGVPGREADFRDVYGPIEAAILAVRNTPRCAPASRVSTRSSPAPRLPSSRRRRGCGRAPTAASSTRCSPRRWATSTPAGWCSRLGAPRVSLRAAPLGPSTDARMVAELAKSTLRLTTGAQPGELCRASFTGPVPDIRADRAGTLTVRYRSRLDWRARQASLGLSPEVPWSIDIGGGLSGLSGDLRGLRLRSLDLRGGVDELELDLPEPDGTSRIHVTGSPANVTLLHPKGCAVRVTVSGGIHEVRFGAEAHAPGPRRAAPRDTRREGGRGPLRDRDPRRRALPEDRPG